MDNATYTVTGMHCQSCVANVSDSVGEVPGVTSVEVTLEDERVVVTGAFDDAAVRAAIEQAGYQAA